MYCPTNIASNSDIPNIDTIIELDGVLMCGGHHVLPLSMDAFNSCLQGLVRDEEDKYRGTVVGIDGCVYGIPGNSKRIVKCDPINDSTSSIGEVLMFSKRNLICICSCTINFYGYI